MRLTWHCGTSPGKAAGLPVCELLGGSVRDRIPVYATGLYYTEDDFPDALTEEALGYAQAGFTGDENENWRQAS